MGKKDLLKSTTKKKKAQKKKKVAAKKAAPKKAAAKKAAPKKAAAKKAPPAKKLTGKELLLQQFTPWKPAKLFSVAPDKEKEKQYTAPPFFPDKSKEEQESIKKLLTLNFDIKEIIKKGEKAAAEKAAAEKAAAEKTAAEKAAAEKAAAEKAAAEKAAAEKAAAEKAAAEKAAAEKAAAEKAAAEKAAAEKAAAEKAAAEKAAAEKAAAEKAAAEKAAAEKAAAEKAAAEKAAAEKAAAEKAAAEKAAAEKAVAEKAAAEKAAAAPPAPAPVEPPAASYAMEKKETDPLTKILTILGACLAVIFTPIIIASFLNTTNYYLRTTDGALELWQGSFAPMGQCKVISMPGAVAPETIRDVYTRKEIFPVVAGYLLDKADTLIEINDLPDFQDIKSTLAAARSYAVTKEIKAQIDRRLTKIEFMDLLYKADVAAEPATAEGKETAVFYLEKAAALELDAHEAQMVAEKIKVLQPPAK